MGETFTSWGRVVNVIKVVNEDLQEIVNFLSKLSMDSFLFFPGLVPIYMETDAIH